LRNHAAGIASVDLFVVQTISLKLLYGLVILRHARKRLVNVSVTSNPTAEWIAGQVTDAFPWNEAPRHLIRDCDGAFGPAYIRRTGAMGIRDHPQRRARLGRTATLSGQSDRCGANLSTTSSCSAKRTSAISWKAYASYYNNVRPRLSLDKDAPDFRKIGRIAAISILGGLHHQYVGLRFSLGTTIYEDSQPSDYRRIAPESTLN